MAEKTAGDGGTPEASEPSMVHIHPDELRGFAVRALVAISTPEDIATEVSRHLVGANLAGHDSHGVLRLPWYVRAGQEGSLNVSARPELVEESGVCALFDAHRGFGHYATSIALEWVVARASEQGLASAAIRDAHHIGRLGDYTERVLERGLVSIVTVGNAGPASRLTRPFGGAAPFLGTNPWSLGVPGQSHRYMYDAATTTVAEGKVRVAQSRGTALPDGCIVDRSGRPSSDPEDLYAGGFMLPLGGEVAGHKGFGLGLGAALFGALSQSDPARPLPEDGSAGGVWMLVLDPGAFGSGDRYRERVERTLAGVKRTAPVDGGGGVLVPGEPEERNRRNRAAGIPLPEATWQDLLSLAESLKIRSPAVAEPGRS